MKFRTLDALIEAYDEGSLSRDDRLVVDNDSVSLWHNGECVFERHPSELLEDALTALRLPWELV